MNDLPYSKAIRVDNRNIFLVFYSIIIDKLELISIFCSDYKLKIIIFAEYILGLLINFFFNPCFFNFINNIKYSNINIYLLYKIFKRNRRKNKINHRSKI